MISNQLLTFKSASLRWLARLDREHGQGGVLQSQDQQVDHVRPHEGATLPARGDRGGREDLRPGGRGGLGQVSDLSSMIHSKERGREELALPLLSLPLSV